MEIAIKIELNSDSLRNAIGELSSIADALDTSKPHVVGGLVVDPAVKAVNSFATAVSCGLESAPVLTETRSAQTPADNCEPLEVDARGVPWDKRINTRTKSKDAEGNWKYQRGTDQSTIDAVEGELVGLMDNADPQTADAPPPPPVVAPPPPPSPPAPPVVTAPAATTHVEHAPPPPPPPPPPPVTGQAHPYSFQELAGSVTIALRSGSLDALRMAEVFKLNNLPQGLASLVSASETTLVKVRDELGLGV